MALALESAALPISHRSVQLLGGFSVVDGGEVVQLPADAQKVVAFLALQPHPVPRSFVAGTLWMDASEQRAHGNLRSALWRLRKCAGDLIVTTNHTMRLAASSDVAFAAAAAQRLCSEATCAEADHETDLFIHDLLPGWYDEFVVVERERLRQVALHALEAIARRLTEKRCYAAALGAALTAVRLEPLRESAHRATIAVHLAEGNQSEAFRQYSSYAELLDTQLGLTPSRLIRGMFEGDLGATLRRAGLPVR